ncbi:MAG: sel1 repeat family protein [Myxococcales bacterium]|nr:sel1 repeat family protein [Myxococcales bacterium]
MHAKPSYQMTGHEVWAAAQSGQDPAALLTLARMMAHGFRGLRGDEAQVVALEQQAAALGHPRALRRLGDRYSRGDGVEASDEAAVMWWRRAAQAGDLDAMANLGSALAATAPAEAHAWLAHAAAQGHPYAIATLRDGQPKATLGDFANMSLEQMAAGAAASDDGLSWSASEVKATVEQLNHLAGLWIEHLRTRLYDVATATTIDGDDADFPCPDPRALPASIIADNASIEVTVRSGVVHLQLDATWWDDGWSLALTSYEPHPPAEARAWLVSTLTAVAAQVGVRLVSDD